MDNNEKISMFIPSKIIDSVGGIEWKPNYYKHVCSVCGGNGVVDGYKNGRYLHSKFCSCPKGRENAERAKRQLPTWEEKPFIISADDWVGFYGSPAKEEDE